ncbi:primosomal replication protein PriC [Thalassotalea sp. 1_MG-2023]|uniref:primosomal replication protein PriC n=1 Tax=Thalassotalea sp. 1_MG-2023 TaxID=3062680 RepID=UPI0026E29618|nr:primosomal replication protein PriC [Thalassotalea sp. 1_MG-2023]MDO6428002.1 primosomal replication protein PriC [Thalassotalea sp. 1_MG-2023]
MVSTPTLHTLNKLEEIVKQLVAEAQAIDDQLAAKKAKQHNTKHVFSPPLFTSQADTYLPYSLEVKKKVHHVSRLIDRQEHNDFVFNELKTIEQQINALTTAFHAQGRQQQIEQQFSQKNRAKYFKKAAKQVLNTSHHLHQKLAETHEFERRLMEMLELKEIELHNANNATQENLSQQVLTLHQRLGRCRQAISKIERQIEMSEKR